MRVNTVLRMLIFGVSEWVYFELSFINFSLSSTLNISIKLNQHLTLPNAYTLFHI